MWFQLHPLKWWQTVITGRPNNCLPPHLYSAASCPSFIYSSWPHFPIVISVIVAKRQQFRLPYWKQNILIFSVKYGNFAEGNISPVMSSVLQQIHWAPSLFLKELVTSVCVSGQGEGQHRRDFSVALFQVITNKGQQRRPLTLCCQSDTPDQPLCSSEGRSCSSRKVTSSKPSQAHWKGKLVICRKMAFLNYI